MSRDAEKYNSKYVRKDYKKKFKELNLLQEETDHHKSKFEKLNKAFTKGRLISRRLSTYLILLIATNHPEASLTIPLPKTVKRKPQAPMIQILPAVEKSASVPLAARKTI